MTISIKPSGQACGAEIRGIDLTKPLSSTEIESIKSAWGEHHVLSFPDQIMTDDDLETFTGYFGALDDDPFFSPIEGRRYVAAIERHASEKAPVFAESWHTDWSFKKHPPIGTCLFGITIPSQGGDTLFTNQHRARETMPQELNDKVKDLVAIHSAAPAYAPEGIYGQEDPSLNRAMKPIISENARDTQSHPLINKHPINGREAIYGCVGYIIGIENMDQNDAETLLMELHEWQTKPEHVYSHKWDENMLVMWDNRSVLHRATGGYDGHDRLLHRTTIWQ